MINEQEETRLTEKPDWFNLSENEKLEHLYWSTSGTMAPKEVEVKPRWFWQKPKKEVIHPDNSNRYLYCYHSKEEAEAAAVDSDEFWEWDGNPAKTVTLPELMQIARKSHRAGVVVRGFKNGEWAVLKVYYANEPLRGE